MGDRIIKLSEKTESFASKLDSVEGAFYESQISQLYDNKNVIFKAVRQADAGFFTPESKTEFVQRLHENAEELPSFEQIDEVVGSGTSSAEKYSNPKVLIQLY